MPIRLLTSGGGTTTIQPTTSASSVTLTVPSVNANVVTTGDTASVTQAMLGSNVVGKGLAFSAYRDTSTQSITNNTWTKVQFNTKEFDTDNCYDATTNYRFTPTIAGYYQVNSSLLGQGSSISRMIITTVKNGSSGKYGNDIYPYSTGTCRVVVSTLHYMNGTTDYLEINTYISGSGSLTITNQGGQDSYFQAYLVRAA